MTQAQLHRHSSERMPELEPESVALTVTSPPYWNAIDYDVHANGNGSEWYRTRRYSEGFDDYGEYLDLLARIFAEVHRVTKPGGFCAIVIGTVLTGRPARSRAFRSDLPHGDCRLGVPPGHHLAQDHRRGKAGRLRHTEAIPRLLLP